MVAIVASSALFHAKNASQSVFMAKAALRFRVSPNSVNESEGSRCARHSQAPVGVVSSALVKSSLSDWSWVRTDFKGSFSSTIASNAAASSSKVPACNKWSGNRPENMMWSGLMTCRITNDERGGERRERRSDARGESGERAAE